ncbi:hypothetical protein DYB34_009765 [Aphanomyces astaci]|uniref:Uncharacterized protein n=1 Tax=Aphanomyces astaci TaxID=112090 RepID=A0A418C3L3_APHAT|nr:hypothetical protein DYB34_009765 [Aphanomyces astaci]
MYSPGGQKLPCDDATWSQSRDEISTSTLALLVPASSSTSKKRKSIDVAGRLITQDLFNEIIDDQPIRKKTKQPTKKPTKKTTK